MGCPSNDTLVELLQGVLPAEQRVSLQSHLDDCAPCRAALGAAGAEEPHLAPEEMPVTPEAPGRYLVRGEHGRGGQAIVFRAYDRHVGRDVALKELRREHEPGGSSHVLRFLREARITGQLEHPSIAPVHEIGRRDDGRHYYTQKLVGGRTLAEALAGCEGLAARLKLLSHFADVCQAVGYAHDKGVIHRDLKPANIMVGQFGETVVLDWGLAKVRGAAEPHRELSPGILLVADHANTIAGTVMGTPSYMSPEQASGRSDQVDERSDVFSLGVVLYEILTGALPFTALTAAGVVFKVANDSPRPVRALCPEAPAELAAVAERALAHDPGGRYPTAHALAQEIEAFQSGTRVGAYEYSSWELLRRFVRKNRALTTMGAIAALILLVAGALLYRDDRRAKGQLAETLVWRGQAAERDQQWAQAAAFYAAARVQGDRQDARFGLAISAARGALPLLAMRAAAPGALSFSPDGKLLAGPSGSSLIIWDSFTGERLTEVALGGGKIYSASFAPDGGAVAAIGDDGKVRLVEPRTGKRLGEIAAHAEIACCVAFANGGRQLATSSMDGTVRVFDIASGRETARQKLSGYAYAIAWSPDGQLLAIPGEDRAVRLWELATGAVTVLEGHESDVGSAVFSPDGKLLASMSLDKTARLWDVAARKQVARLELGAAGVFARPTFSPDGRTLATPGADNSILIWDVETHERLLRINAHRDLTVSLLFAPDGRLASAGNEGTVRIWEVRTALAALGRLGRTRRELRAVAYSPGGKLLAAAGFDGRVELWDPSSGASRGALVSGPPVLSVAFSPDGKLIATGGHDGAVTLWEEGSRKQRVQFRANGAPIVDVAFSPDGGTVVASALDEKLRFWEVTSGSERAAVARGANLTFAAAGALVATADATGVLLWDAATGALRQRLPAVTMASGLALSADGSRLVTAVTGQDVTMVDLKTGRELWRAPAPAGVQSMFLSPDGSLLAIAAATVDVLDARTGLLVTRRGGPEGYAPRAAFSPDGAQLAFIGLEGILRVLELRGAARLGPPEQELAAVLARYRLQLSGVTLSEAK